MNKENKLAPIVLFVYNRSDHTRQTIEALKKNQFADESNLFIFSDAEKNENDKAEVNKVREYIKTIKGFRQIITIERDTNWGLSNSIADGVSKIIKEFGSVIVLEDDLVTSPYFLKFMNESLELYKEKENVYSITGYSHTDYEENIDSSYFLNLTSSWSWATWLNRWEKFKRDDNDLRKIIKSTDKEKKYFNFNDSVDYINMAKLQLENKIDSWAIYWYLTVFRQNGLTLYPKKKLVMNIGFDGSGTHCSKDTCEEDLVNYYPQLTRDIKEKPSNRKIVSNLLKANKSSIIMRGKAILKRKLGQKQKMILTKFLSKLKLIFYKKDIGNNSYVDKTVHVLGWRNVSIGSNCIIGENTWLNVNHKVNNFKSIEIQDNSYIGKRVTISSAKKVLIRNYSLIADDCKLLGANHNYQNPLEPYAMTGASAEEVIIIGVNVWIGNTACIVGDVNIGHGSVIGAGSLVTKDIPPFCIAVGNPCKVIKRYDFDKMEWLDESEGKSLSSCNIPSESEYLSRLKTKKLNTDAYRFASSKSFGDLI